MPNSVIERWSASGILPDVYDVPKIDPIEEPKVLIFEILTSAYYGENFFDRKPEGFETVAFPLVRRVFSQFLAQDLVSVQPLAAPTGLLFYMDTKLSESNRKSETKQKNINSSWSDSLWNNDRWGDTIMT